MTYNRLITISFILNGLTGIAMKAANELGITPALNVLLLATYLAASAAALVPVLRARTKLSRRSVLVGVLAGAASAIGMSAATRAIALLPGHVVFPLYSGGTLLLVVIAGWLGFKERIGPFGVAGILVGAAAIVLLSG